MVRLASALFLFWERRNHVREGIEWLEEGLTRLGNVPPVIRAAGLRVQGALMWRIQSELDRALIILQESITLYRASDVDLPGVAGALQSLGLILVSLGRDSEAKPLLEESLAIWRSLIVPGSVGTLLCNLGGLAEREGELDRARALQQEALEQSRQACDRWLMGVCLLNLALLEVERAEHARARSLCLEALASFRQIGDMWFSAAALELLASIALSLSEPARAVRLLAVSQGLRTRLNLFRRERFEEIESRARAQMSQAEWTEAWHAGVALTWDQGVNYALELDPYSI
jgi:non-specific serine/threonine protein kinase